jgi:hypothetical protein
LFQGRNKKGGSVASSSRLGDINPNSSLFMSAIEEIFDIELEKKQQIFE